MAQITIYTTPTCVYCRMAKEFFKENNVEYQEKDVSQDKQALEEMIQKSGQTGIPVIDIDGNITIGFKREKIAELLGIKA